MSASSLTNIGQEIGDLLSNAKIAESTVILVPPRIPLPCFPNLVKTLLEKLLTKEWNLLSSRAQNYLQWISVKAESIDVLAPRDLKTQTKGFELLAIDREGRSFGDILHECKNLEIPSVMIRFATLIVAFITLRLLRQQSDISPEFLNQLMFTQNVDGNYLNYPMALKTLLDLFPEQKSKFYFEVNESVNEDYLSTIRTLARDLGIRLVLDDTNRMNVALHWQLMDLADWIKIDFKGTAILEKLLKEGKKEFILAHFDRYASGSHSLVIVLEGLSENSPLKEFLEKHWWHTGISLYYQSRERLPKYPWNNFFGVIQDYKPGEFGLFFKGLITEKPQNERGVHSAEKTESSS